MPPVAIAVDMAVCPMPVLGIGGEMSFGENVGNGVRAVADDVQSLVIPDTGHFLAEESPDELLAALTAFLAPYRDRGAAVPEPRQPGADVTTPVR